MPNKKTDIIPTDDGLTPEEAHRVEVKVDRMLDPKAPDTAPKDDTAATSSEDSLPPLDIFADPKSAPAVPKGTLKEAAIAEPKAVSKSADNTDKPDAATTDAALAEQADEGMDKAFVEDKTTEAAIDDITTHESDEVLAAQDADIAKAFDPNKPTLRQKIKGWISSWWHNKRSRYGTLAGLFVLLVVLAIVPATRAFALNIVGVRASAQATILDNTTQLPLKNVQVSLGGSSAMTNDSGAVTLQHVKLGSQKLLVHKIAFADITKQINIGFGSNKLGNLALTAVGTQYKFNVVDYVSGRPVPTAAASSGDSNAVADSKGQIILTTNTGANPGNTVPVKITAANYADAKIMVPLGSSAVTNVQLVSARPEVYISKQSGKYDVYKAGVDGQNKQVILAGTGNENDQLSLLTSPNGEEVALVSTRDNQRDSGGYLLQTLTLINLMSGASTTIDHSEKIQLVDWFGTRLVYVEIKAGASAGNPARYGLMSYDYPTNQRLQLDHANYFNDVVSADGSVYYATSNQYAGGVSQFNKINADNSGKQTLLSDEVWNIFRTDYNDFALSSATNSYTYKIGDSKPATTPNAYSGTNRLYADSPDGKQSAWVDNRDGKGALIIYDKSTQKESVVLEQSGLTNPIRWLDNGTIVYRVTTPQETADYVVDTQAKAGKKITDVTDARGLTLWYYY